MWEPLTARNDLFSELGNFATLIDEQIVKVGSDSYLVGQSEVKVTFI